jgi:uncharacterized protein DUF1844
VAENEKPIKVSDFRMFTPDGRLKPEYQDLENAAPPAPAAPPAEPSRQADSTSVPEAGGRPSSEEGLEADFVDLVRLLATNAYAAMGFVSEPGRKAAPPDLDSARRMIDWLSVIERKTRNNLSFAEQNLLSQILYELRMAYVEATAPAGPAAR